MNYDPFSYNSDRSCAAFVPWIKVIVGTILQLFVRHLCLSPPLAFAFVPLRSALVNYIPGFCAYGVAQ